MGLSTASLFLPVFLAREYLGIEKGIPLKTVLGSSFFSWSWSLFGLAIFFGIVFHFLSAKWIRLAWGQKAGILGFDVSEQCVENSLEVFFWATVSTFIGGHALIFGFFLGH